MHQLTTSVDLREMYIYSNEYIRVKPILFTYLLFTRARKT